MAVSILKLCIVYFFFPLDHLKINMKASSQIDFQKKSGNNNYPCNVNNASKS